MSIANVLHAFHNGLVELAKHLNGVNALDPSGTAHVLQLADTRRWLAVTDRFFNQVLLDV